MGALLNPYLPSDRPAGPVLPLEPELLDGPLLDGPLLGPACALRNPYWGADCWSRWEAGRGAGVGSVAPQVPLPEDELCVADLVGPAPIPEPPLLLLLALALALGGTWLRGAREAGAWRKERTR